MTRLTDNLTPGEMIDLLGIDLERLRVWLEKGFLGDEHRKTGRGKPRMFSRRDAIIALVIRELMDLTQSRSLKIAKLELANEMARLMPKILDSEGAVISGSTGKPNPRWWLIISFDRAKNDWHVTSEQGGSGTAFPIRMINTGKPSFDASSERLPGQAVIMIPLGELVERVDRFFDRKETR